MATDIDWLKYPEPWRSIGLSFREECAAIARGERLSFLPFCSPRAPPRKKVPEEYRFGPRVAEFEGGRLRTARIAANLSQDGLAQLTGLTQGRISDYEIGDTKPSRASADAIAAALGVEVETLYRHFE